MADPTAALAYAFGLPEATATIRARVEDFMVEEMLRFAPEGEGPHAFLKIRKRAQNTHDVARALARYAGVRPVEVGFGGLKDRNAVTAQWFSVNLGARADPDWCAMENDRLEVLDTTRHAKKLRPGQIRENRFRIVLRDIDGDGGDIESRLERIAAQGVPNYFGPQRFGRDGANLDAARKMFIGGRAVRDRRLRGLYLSAARAEVFNRVLSHRVASGTWNRALSGEVLMFDDSRSRFASEGDDAGNDPRIEALDLHPTGPLWGLGSADAASEAGRIEQEAVKSLPDLTAGLEAAGLNADRRALRLRVTALDYQGSDADRITLTFSLRPGAFATSVLREVALIRDRRIIQRGTAQT